MATPQKPDPSRTLAAIDIYLNLAYDGVPSITARTLMASLRGWGGEFYAAPVFARTGDPNSPRFSVRLGNRHYPHMKLVMEPAPGGGQYLFRVDTHDRHVCPPPESPEHAAFCDLMQRNQELAGRIEAEWAKNQLPTFKTYLQDDLARRQSSQGT